MAKKSKIAKNEQRKVIVARYADKRAELKKTLIDENASDEAREAARLGLEYGIIARDSHVSLADVVRAFLYFRSLVDESLLQLAEVQGTREHQDLPWAESLRQVQLLTNELLPALIESSQMTETDL